MQSLSAPVVVMRWFREGSGYAYDQQVDEPTLVDLIKGIHPVFSQPPGHSFRHVLPDGRVVLGDVEAETYCLDDRAATRRPTVLRAVLLPNDLSEGQENTIRKHLRALPLPTAPGAYESGMSVPLPAAVTLPEPEQAISAGLRRVGPWVVLVLLLGMEIYLQTQPGLGNSVAGWASRVAGLLAALGLYRFSHLRLATREELIEQEKSLTSGLHLQWHLLVDDDVWLVLGDGRRLKGSMMRRANPSFLPVAISEPNYEAVQAYPGLAILQGRERIRLADGRELDCEFARGYARRHGQWRLKFVQWTPTTPRAGDEKPGPVDRWRAPLERGGERDER